MARFDQPVPERPVIGEFGEPLYEPPIAEAEPSWWDLPIEGGEDVESIDPGFAWTPGADPYGEAGPGYTTTYPVGDLVHHPLATRGFGSATEWATAGGGRPSYRPPTSFHLRDVERGLLQQARIRTLREAARPERRLPPAIKPGRLEHPDIVARRQLREQKKQRTLADLQFQIQEMELQKQIEMADLNRQLEEARLHKAIREAKRAKKKPKRRKRMPVWGI